MAPRSAGEGRERTLMLEAVPASARIPGSIPGPERLRWAKLAEYHEGLEVPPLAKVMCFPSQKLNSQLPAAVHWRRAAPVRNLA